MKPTSTRQLVPIVVEAAQATDIAKRLGPDTLRHSFVIHLLASQVNQYWGICDDVCV